MPLIKPVDKSIKYRALVRGLEICWSYSLPKLKRYIRLYQANGLSGIVTIVGEVQNIRYRPYTTDSNPVLHAIEQ